jgi:hypothetical protein
LRCWFEVAAIGAMGKGEAQSVLYTPRMDIHAPDRPILTLKEFLVHILVVTCGILIALGLEGVRETIHDHRLVRETRETVRAEMANNLHECEDELPRVTRYSKELKDLATDLPVLAQQHPDAVSARLKNISNPGYFFVANSWQAALSTGALEHMSPDEVNSYGGSAEGIKIYSALQKEAEAREAETKAYFAAHPKLAGDQLAEGMERLLLFSHSEASLAFVAPQMKENMERALRAASSN